MLPAMETTHHFTFILPLLDGDVAVFVLVAIGVIGLIAVLGYYSWRAEKKRREALQAWATARGFSFNYAHDTLYATRFSFLDPLRQGANRYAYNVMVGQHEGRNVTVADFHYETYSTDSKGRRQTHHHHFTLLTLALDVYFPHELKIRPEGFFDKLTAMVGFDDIDFESNEFSKRFHVKASDKKFAYDIIHQRMMEVLLNHRSTRCEMEQNTIALFSGGARWKPEQLDAQLTLIREIEDHLPEYLLRDLKTRGS